MGRAHGKGGLIHAEFQKHLFGTAASPLANAWGRPFGRSSPLRVAVVLVGTTCKLVRFVLTPPVANDNYRALQSRIAPFAGCIHVVADAEARFLAETCNLELGWIAAGSIALDTVGCSSVKRT